MGITLVGIGMGGARTMTLEAREALVRADVVIGAERLLAHLPEGVAAEKIALTLPEKVAAAIADHPEWREVCVVLSGDVGFYSGAKRLLALLHDRSPRLVPGISAVQYFAARLRRPWQDFRLVSAHGVHCDVLAEVLNHRAVFFLTGGETAPSDIVAVLCDAGLHEAKVTVGENLSYSDECVTSSTAGELAGRVFAPLSVVLVENDKTFVRESVSAGVPDAEFIRGAAPMTKREVRALALSLLCLRADDIVYDVGAGTGSVAVECALLARRGRVYAVESDAGAFELLCANREKFGVYNVCPVSGTAPEALEALPPPQVAFVGGSKGNLRGILEAIVRKNSAVRLVVSAITLETLAAAQEFMRELAVPNIDVVQLAASRAVARGGYHMLEAQNPVFLVSGGRV